MILELIKPNLMKSLLDETEFYRNIDRYLDKANAIGKLLFFDIKLELKYKYFYKYIYPNQTYIKKEVDIEVEIQKYLTLFIDSPLKVRYLIDVLDKRLELFKTMPWFEYDVNTSSYNNATNRNHYSEDKLKRHSCYILFNELSSEIERFFEARKKERIKTFLKIRKELLKVSNIGKLKSLSLNEGKLSELKKLHKNIQQFLSAKSNSLTNFINCFSEKNEGEFTPLELNFTINQLIYFLDLLMENKLIKEYKVKQIPFVFRGRTGKDINQDTFKTERSKLKKSDYDSLSETDLRKINNLFNK